MSASDAPIKDPVRSKRYRRLLGVQHRDQNALRQRSAQRIAAVLLEYVTPASVLDVGCGTGSFLAAVQQAGVADVQGVDGPWLDPATLCIDADRVTVRDLEHSLDLNRRFDLVASMEVAEHLEPARAEGFVADLASHGDLVLFSAAVPFQGGAGHINERWPSWWANKFRQHGFVPVDVFRPRLWDETGVLWWLRQNLLLYAREQRLTDYPRLTSFYRSGHLRMPLDVVHPVLLAQYALRAGIAHGPPAMPPGRNSI